MGQLFTPRKYSIWGKGETERFPVDLESGLFKYLKKRERKNKAKHDLL